MKVYENHQLAPYTTMGIGGTARYFVEAENDHDICEALELAKKEQLPIFILGAGSNTLVCDEGFQGVVIHLAINTVTWNDDEVEIGAGAVFDEVVAESCRRNLGGIEALSGIPGSAGGSLVQNIGAYGQEISEVFVSANAIHRETGETRQLSREDMDFGYRHTALKTADNPWIVTSVTLRLTSFDVQKAVDRSVAHGFRKIVSEKPQNASDLRRAVLETRHSKRMCYDRDDINTHSVGSFFVNPVVDALEESRLQAQSIAKSSRPMPSYKADGGMKLSAAWLIENAGFARGYSYKGAGLSAFHCLAIINRGIATCADVRELAADIVRAVRRDFRVTLQPEVVYLGVKGIQSLPL